MKKSILGLSGAAALLAISASTANAGLIISEDFNSATSDVTYNGSAFQDIGSGRAILTRNAFSQTGSIWFNTPNNIDQFSVSFDFFVGNNTGGADGITFAVIDSVSPLTTIGSGGGNMGYAGIGNPSFAVEFDTWSNGSSRGDQGNGNHVGLVSNSGAGTQYGAISALASPLEDGAIHSALIEFNNASIEVFVDGSSVLTGSYAAGAIPANGYFGFTGATGGARNLQYVDNVVISTASVPVPGTLALMGLGLAGLGFIGKRKSR